MSFDNGVQPPLDKRAAKASGKQILSATWTMLQEDRQLFVLPAISIASSVVAALILFVPGFALGRSIGGTNQIGIYVGIFFASVVATIISIFFQAALVVGAFQRAEGVQPTVNGVLAEAWRLRGPIFGWAALTTTVGVAVRALQERLGILGSILGFLGGLAWAIVSFLVIPVLVAEGIGPVAAMKRSSQLLRDTWGTSLRTTVRFGLLQLLAVVVLMVGFVVGIGVLFTGGPVGSVLGSVILLVCLVAMFGLITAVSAVSVYSRALIYRYATGLPVPGIPAEVLAGAFVQKKRRR